VTALCFNVHCTSRNGIFLVVYRVRLPMSGASVNLNFTLCETDNVESNRVQLRLSCRKSAVCILCNVTRNHAVEW